MPTIEKKFLLEGKSYPISVRVVIAGGGIGGMALALSLHDAGFRNVDVYESASSVKELGVGINVLPHATRELAELEEISRSYKRAAGFDPEVLNNRPSLSVGRHTAAEERA
jgi:flavin-dependent dehydrogenase